MTLHFIGDAHGKIQELKHIVKNIPQNQEIFQVGDLGLGFCETPTFGANFSFIRGNHDSPPLAEHHPNYLGDYGYDRKNKLYYISGAYSIDYTMRTEYINWWRDEELSYQIFENVIQDCIDKQPEIILSHDCPYDVIKYMKSHHIEQSRTNMALNTIFETCQPKLWIFGHHHNSFDRVIYGTRFVCLAELEYKSF